MSAPVGPVTSVNKSDAISGNSAPIMSAPAQVSPWGVVKTKPAVSLEEAMSEEFIKEIQKQDEEERQQQAWQRQQEMSMEARGFGDYAAHGENDTTSDFLLAQSLQHEMNREYDVMLLKQEEKYNGTSKVSMSYNNYRMVHPAMQDNEEEVQPLEAEEFIPDDSDLHLTYKAGLAVHNNKIVSKHDANICGKKNMYKVMDQFPPDIMTGDFGGDDVRLSNRVYNKLKKHSQTEVKRSTRLHEKKEHSTAQKALDEKTSLVIYKLINNLEIIGELSGPIATGKESVVFHATGGSAEGVPKELAVKAFKTTLTDFKNRAMYIKGDVRYFKDDMKKRNTKKVMKIWTLKEDNNLRRMARHGIPCPRVVATKKHIIVMEFIGSDRKPAPTLREASLSVAEAELCWEQCLQNMKRMYHNCHLVHADLSPYNLLWYKDILYFIDVGQAVEVNHPLAYKFLLKDCENVCKFFTKCNVHDVPTPYALFNDVTGLQLEGEGEMFIQQIEKFVKEKDMLNYNADSKYAKEYPFDFFYDKATAERLANADASAQLDSDSDSLDSNSQDSDIEEKEEERGSHGQD